MGDTSKPGADKLPGNHGQFGADVETENYETLPDLGVADPEAPGPGTPDPGAPDPGTPDSGAPGPGARDAATPGDAAEAPAQHQEQGGMRS